MGQVKVLEVEWDDSRGQHGTGMSGESRSDAGDWTGTYSIALTDLSATNVTNLPGIQYEPIQRRWLPLRRLWWVVSCIPRYLISGSVEVP